MRVLYIEGEEAAVEAVRMTLGRASPAIAMEAAATMREGLSHLRRRHDYDLVLTDTRLPDGDGLGVLAHIRGRSLPVAVVLTTRAGDEESAVAALKAGADDCIAERPGYLVHLPQRLLEAVERRRVEVSRLSRPLRVLYLEDSHQDSEQAILHLARCAPHIRLDVVDHPAELLKLVSSDTGPDCQVLLLDCGLPGMDDLELLAELRRTRASDLAVVLITAPGNEEIAVQALRLGASDYVVKRSGYLLKLPSVLENAYHRTSLERAHAKLLQSEEKYRALVEHLPVVVYTTALDRTSTVKYIGPQIKEMLGYTIEEWLASPGNWARSVHPDDKAMVVAERTRCNAQAAPFEAEYRMVARDGRVVWVHDTTAVVRDAGGQPALRQGVANNITSRKVMEMALKESEERYRDLFENANDIVFILDLQGRFLSVNRAGETATGYMRQREEPLYLDHVVAPEHLGAARQAVAKVAAGGDPLLFELEVMTQDGRRLTLEVGTRAIVRDGQPVGVQGIARDITEQKRAQDSLRESETRFRNIFEDAPVGIALIDADHRILKSNRRLSDILGYTKEELVSLTIDDLTHPEDVGKDMDLADRLLRGDIPGYKLETRLVRKDGEVRYAQLTTTFIRDQEGQPVHGLGMVEDITERKVQEERICLQINRLDALRSIDMAITSSLDPRVTFDVLLDHVITQLRSDAATILLLDPHSHYLQYAAGRGFRTAALRHTHLRLGEGHAGRAALERKLIAVQDLGENPGDFTRAPLLSSEGFVSYFVAPLIAKAQVKGVLEIFCREPFDPSQEWLDYLETLGGQGAIAIDNATLFDDLQRANTDLTLAYDTTLEGWARAVDLRDKETEGHSRRVADLAVRLGRVVGMSEAELVHVRRGSLLHDIGKLGIPDGILLKPGPLAEKEWEEMRKHPVYAYEMLAPIAFLRQALDIPYCHHEKWDGTGYPRGIKGDQIPLSARIFAVVDVLEALSSDRPYRGAWPEDRVREYIVERAGTQFDPEAVKAFLDEGLL